MLIELCPHAGPLFADLPDTGERVGALLTVKCSALAHECVFVGLPFSLVQIPPGGCVVFSTRRRWYSRLLELIGRPPALRWGHYNG